MCITFNQPDTKSNPNATTEQHAVLTVQQYIVTCPTHPEKFIRDSVVSTRIYNFPLSLSLCLFLYTSFVADGDAMLTFAGTADCRAVRSHSSAYDQLQLRQIPREPRTDRRSYLVVRLTLLTLVLSWYICIIVDAASTKLSVRTTSSSEMPAVFQ